MVISLLLLLLLLLLLYFPLCSSQVLVSPLSSSDLLHHLFHSPPQFIDFHRGEEPGAAPLIKLGCEFVICSGSLGLLLQSLICVAHFHRVKLCYKQRDKIGFLRVTSGQFGKYAQPPMVTWKVLQHFCAMVLFAAFPICGFSSQMKTQLLKKGNFEILTKCT